MRVLVILFILFQSCISLGQSKDHRVKVTNYAIDQLTNKGHLYLHFTDSISRSFLYDVKAGKEDELNEAQLQLAYYSVIFDPIIYEDSAFFKLIDDLSPKVIKACGDFGFYKIVWSLEELREYYILNSRLYLGKPQYELFDAGNENFDNQLYELRMDFWLVIHDFLYQEERLDVISAYLLAHQNEIMQFYSNEK